jgi:hypothetical protein
MFYRSPFSFGSSFRSSTEGSLSSSSAPVRHTDQIVILCSDAGLERVIAGALALLGERNPELTRGRTPASNKSGVTRVAIRFGAQEQERSRIEHALQLLKQDPVVRSVKLERLLPATGRP